jgi:hypothetical protein
MAQHVYEVEFYAGDPRVGVEGGGTDRCHAHSRREAAAAMLRGPVVEVAPGLYTRGNGQFARVLRDLGRTIDGA